MPAPAKLHSFVIRIWLEEKDEETGDLRWRGHITHVHSQKDGYVQTFDDLTAFIRPYLEKMQEDS